MIQTIIRLIRQSIQNRPRLIFTRGGKVFFVATVALGIAALNSGNNLLYLVLSMMLSFILSSGVLSSLNLHKVRVKRSVYLYQNAKQEIQIDLVLNNAKTRWPSLGLHIHDALHITSQQPYQSKHQVEISSIYMFAIKAQKNISKSYTFTLPHRGVYQIQGIKLSTQFPFALFEKSIILNMKSKVYVLPARLDHTMLDTNSAVSEIDISDLSSKHDNTEASQVIHTEHILNHTYQNEMELSHIRPLQHGEGLKKIHWKASARRGEWMRYVYEEQSPSHTEIYLHPYYDQDQSFEYTQDLIHSMSERWAEGILAYYIDLSSYFQTIDIYLIDPTQKDMGIVHPHWEINSHYQDETTFYQWLCTMMLSASNIPMSIATEGMIFSTQQGCHLVDYQHATLITLI